jgi:hypothetical protein
MVIWLCALAAGAAAALWMYGGRLSRPAAAAALALRAIAVTGAIALLLNAVVGARRAARPLVALDVSASWLRGHDTSAFASAVNRARGDGNGGLLAFGDSTRTLSAAAAAGDVASRVRPAVERALAGGRPLEVVTDGEIDDPDALAALPGGSRVIILGTRPSRDVAVSEVRIPRAAVAGDTVEAGIGLVAASAGAPAGQLTITLGDRRVETIVVDSLGPFGERLVHARIAVPAVSGALLLRAAVEARGDEEPRNDTLAVTLDISPGAAAVLVATSPDYDVRELAAVLRGTVSLPTRGFYRVAPEVWREDGSLAPATIDVVRRAARDAPLLIVDGDTALFGEPRAFARGSLLLIAPPTSASGEWFATGTPVSPMAATLGGSPWDSLPPLDVAAQIPEGDFEILETRRARRLDRRVAAVGWEHPRRVVLVAASGFWRWRFHGGVGTGVHAAFWGSVIDWLSAERSDVRAAVPVDGAVRAGQPVRWRRGSAVDTVVTVTLTRRSPPASDTLTLRFPGGTLFAETPPLQVGTYDLTMRGGRAMLVVNPSAEYLPRRPSVRAGAVGAAVALSDAPRLRSSGWIFALVIAALCAEWIMRRRLGLR